MVCHRFLYLSRKSYSKTPASRARTCQARQEYLSRRYWVPRYGHTLYVQGTHFSPVISQPTAPVKDSKGKGTCLLQSEGSTSQRPEMHRNSLFHWLLIRILIPDFTCWQKVPSLPHAAYSVTLVESVSSLCNSVCLVMLHLCQVLWPLCYKVFWSD